MNTIEALEKRRSVRGYTNQPIEEDKLNTILKYGNKAPNVGPFQMSVISNSSILKTINDTVLEIMKSSDNEFMKQRASIPDYHPLYGAPTLIVLSAPDNDTAAINTSCAVTNMSIAATELGLGSCYVMGAIMMLKQNSEFCKQVGIPDNYVPICGLLLGYESEKQIPGRTWKDDRSNINYVS